MKLEDFEKFYFFFQKKITSKIFKKGYKIEKKNN